MIILDTLTKRRSYCQYKLGPVTAQLLGGHGRPSRQIRHHARIFPHYLWPVTETWLATDSQNTPTCSKTLPHCHCTKVRKWSMCKRHCSARPLLLYLLPTDTWSLFLLRYDRSLGGTVKQRPIHPIPVVTTWRSGVYQLLSLCYTFIEVKIKFSGSEDLLFYFLILSFLNSTKETKKEKNKKNKKENCKRSFIYVDNL